MKLIDEMVEGDSKEYGSSLLLCIGKGKFLYFHQYDLEVVMNTDTSRYKRLWSIFDNEKGET